MSDAFVIRTEGLAKTFPGGVQAVTGLDLGVPRGAVYGLIGRNGAGKTTALRLIMGLLRPDAGRVAVLGRDLWTADHRHRQRVTYVPQEQQFPGGMGLVELCAACAAFYERWDQGYAENLARRFGLPWDRAIGTLSGGERRKAAILLALSARPELVVLDEPAAGLDPLARRELLDALIEALGEGGDLSVLFSSHILSDLERVADHVGIMELGRLLRAAPLAELQSATKRVQLIFPGGTVPADFTLPGALRVAVEGPVYTAVVQLAAEDALDGLATRLGARVQVFPLGLEDLFIELVSAEGRREVDDAW